MEGLQKAWQRKAKGKKRFPGPWVDQDIALPVQNHFTRVSTSWKVNIVGPTPDVYAELLQELVVQLYDSAVTVANDSDYGDYKMGYHPDMGGNDIANRGSIITLFRSSQVPRAFDMLFTGDAYDRDCQIQSTVQAFNDTLVTSYVDVLKVPHHCSKNTSDAHFYRTFRAQVYLICAQQRKHGNPALLTLEEIAKGFAQTPAQYAADPNPKLLFFSDPDSLVNVDGYRSNVYQLLSTSAYKPNTTGPTIYNYRCFRLRPGPGTTAANKVASAGRIIFGRNATGGLAVQFTVADAASRTDTDLNDWVEMKAIP